MHEYCTRTVMIVVHRTIETNLELGNLSLCEIHHFQKTDSDGRHIGVITVRGALEQLDGCSVNGTTQSMKRRLSNPCNLVFGSEIQRLEAVPDVWVRTTAVRPTAERRRKGDHAEDEANDFRWREELDVGVDIGGLRECEHPCEEASEGTVLRRQSDLSELWLCADL